MPAANEQIVIAGAGVAGLSAAYRLQGSADVPFIVFERAPYLGGYSRTVQYGDFRFDLGGHRFYTKKAHVHALVEQLVGDDLVEVHRLSRILFNGRFVNYPLSAFNTLKGLGPLGAARAVLDYGIVKLRAAASPRRAASPAGHEQTFEEWALPRFGRYLYDAYFRVYTEKTWGVPCSELSADFAEQRIKGLSFREAVREAILRRSEGESLVRTFVYPRYGFGQIPQALARAVKEPNRILTDHAVVEVEHEGHRIRAVTAVRRDGVAVRQPCCEFINCIAVDELVGLLRPPAPPEVLESARALGYRSLVVLLLVVDVEQVSPDHWIYVPSPGIGFCRMHEPKNWSRDMAPPGRTGLVLEYFCQQGDAVWQREAGDLAAEAARDLAGMGLLQPAWVTDCTAVPLPKAYPVYRLGYRRHLDTVTRYLAGFGNLYNIGRNATFLYTSSDHYVDMGLKAAENVMGHSHNLHEIGRERGYAEARHEEEG
jgi:protoporphyrinogen oxidase